MQKTSRELTDEIWLGFVKKSGCDIINNRVIKSASNTPRWRDFSKPRDPKWSEGFEKARMVYKIIRKLMNDKGMDVIKDIHSGMPSQMILSPLSSNQRSV